MQKSADAFRTISEVAEQLDVPQHVLRFWETRFPQVRPLKRAGGRRYYRPGDVDLLSSIRRLLYDRGYTIKGVQRLLKERGQRGLRDDDPVGLDGVDLDNIATGEDVAPAEVQRGETGANETSGVPLDSRPTSENLEPSVATSLMRSPSGQDHVALRDALAVIEDCERILKALRRPA